MGKYDWSVESDASVVSQTNTTATLRVKCYFKNNNWRYFMYMTGYVSCNDGGMVPFPKRNIDTRPAGQNGRTFIGSHDYIIQKSRGGHNVRYSARVMSDGGYADGDKWSAEHSASIPSLASYTISYNANDGKDAPGNQTRWYGQGDFYLSDTIPSRTGYTFQGWATSSGGSVAYKPGQHYGGDSNLNLYAVWKINTYTVTFVNGLGTTLKTQTVNYGDNAAPPSAPSRTGYTFAGWDGSYTNVTSDRTITAKWTINKYYIDVNGTLDGEHQSGTSPMGTFDVYINNSLAVNDAGDYWQEHNYQTPYKIQDIKANTGYNYTGSSGSALSGNVPAGNVSITLNFTTKGYTVSFNANLGEAVSNMPSSFTKTHFVSVKLPSDVPTARRYEFLGWATSAGGEVRYRPGDMYSTEGSATLYAVWKLKASVVKVYQPDGTGKDGICSIYDDAGNHHYAIFWVYDNNGNRHEVL